VSRLYFHTRDEGTAELMGFEYHHLCEAVRTIARGTVGLDDGDRLKGLMSPEVARSSFQGVFDLRQLNFYRTCTSTSRRGLATFDGKDLDAFHLVLNTAMALGNDPIRLAVRIFGQGDIHAWVDGSNRSWVADIIDEGLDFGVYRQSLRGTSCGWEDVTSLLRGADDAPVVMSYSVERAFPDGRLTDYVYDEDGMSPFDDLPAEEQWDVAMAGLRSEKRPDRRGLEIKPGDWKGVRFGYGLSMLDLLADDYEERIRRALA